MPRVPIPHLISYEHDASRVTIFLVSGPPLAASDQAEVRILRETATYRFQYWVSIRHGNIVGAEILLKSPFYDLNMTPKTLQEDLKWLGLEVGVYDLERCDIWLTVMAASAVWTMRALPESADEGDDFSEDN